MLRTFYFTSKEYAYGFAYGVETINDSAISQIKVTYISIEDEWEVTFEDEDYAGDSE